MSRRIDIMLALCMGVLCHGLFVLGIALMGLGLATGMQSGLGRLPAPWSWIANSALVLQFPLLHSLLLATRGRRLLGRLFGARRGRTLAPTSYVIFASLQLLLVFGLWTPSGQLWWQPQGSSAVAAYALFALSWLLLAKAILDSGVGLQSGSIGWTALLRGNAPAYGGLPTRGLFRRCRQPIYLGFFLVLWTAPDWSPDRLLLVLVWSAYCIVGPVFKERRFATFYGEDFDRYRQRVPYFVPALYNKDVQP
jgi:protein-S-isoprenylcysteine O-methyltransferase Ste14